MSSIHSSNIQQCVGKPLGTQLFPCKEFSVVRRYTAAQGMPTESIGSNGCKLQLMFKSDIIVFHYGTSKLRPWNAFEAINQLKIQYTPMWIKSWCQIKDKKLSSSGRIYIGTFRVESLLPLSRSLLSADQLQIINFVKHGNNWKLENSYLFKNKKLTWSGRHLQHAPWKLQQTFLWYRSTTWQIYQRRHLPTIAHQVKSTHGSQAANRNTDKRITTNAYKVQFFFQYTILKEGWSSLVTCGQLVQIRNYFKTTANSEWMWSIMSINC